MVLAEAQSDISDTTSPPAIGGSEEVVAVQESKAQYTPTKTVAAEKKEESLPDITMKGVVLSDNKQAIILDVNGKIQILTSQKPLPSGIKLVRVSKEEAILAYKGREITLKF
jgi:type II secretory pathway component PulC